MGNKTCMDGKGLPRKIPELRGLSTQNEVDMAKQITIYNRLPVGHKDRPAVYARIQEMNSYNEWD